MGENLLKAVNEQKISIEMIDDKVKRILNVLNFSKRYENLDNQSEGVVNSSSQRQLLKKLLKKGWFY